MNLRHLGARIRPSLLSMAAGWAAATAVTLPVQFAKIVANAFGGPAALLLSLAEGTMIWSAWALAIAAGGWLFGLIPVIALVPDKWLLRHPRTSIAVAAALGWVVVLVEFQVWTLLLPYHWLARRAFVLYTLLLVVFASVSAAVYLRLITPKAYPGTPGSRS
jgi:hypothetical protein